MTVWLLPASAEAVDYTGSTIADLQTFLNGPSVSSNDTIVIQNNLSYLATGHIDNPTSKVNLNLSGSVNSGYSGTISSTINTIIIPNIANPKVLDLSTVDFTTPIDDLIVSLGNMAGTLTTLSGVSRTLSTASASNFDNFQIITVHTARDNLSLTNLQFDFTGATLEYTFNATPINGGGITNPFIGGNNTNSQPISLNQINNNAFQNINIVFDSIRDNHWVAGGGIIGVRATDNSATIDTIQGNYFNELSVTTTNTVDPVTYGKPYIEGGGIIGVNAVSSPGPDPGAATLNTFANNVFDQITITSGDIIMGGGILGVNNNSQNTLETTRSYLGNVTGNIFGNGSNPLNPSITVSAEYSIRGGGVIGLNGLSEAATRLESLTYNFFGGIVVSTNSYIRGGGIVGLQTKDANPDQIKPDDPTQDPTLAAESAHLANAEGNIFYNIEVTAGDNGGDGAINGGGVIGVRGYTQLAEIGTVRYSIFQNISVTSNSPNQTMTYKGEILGGGLIGVSAAVVGRIGQVQYNQFLDNAVSASGTIYGGGLVGAQADPDAGLTNAKDDIGAVLTSLDNNKFEGNTVNAGLDLFGGGIAGVTTKTGVSASFDEQDPQVGFTNNVFEDTTVSVSRGLYGGGIVGAANTTASEAASIAYFAYNDIQGSDISAYFIEGGGILGAQSNGYASLGIIDFNTISNNSVMVNTFLDGGGIIGVTGAASSNPLTSIGKISNTLIEYNTITARNGIIYGGIIYAYGSFGDGLIIENSTIADNDFYADLTGGLAYNNASVSDGYGVYGTIVVDTGVITYNQPAKLTLRATSGDGLWIENNIIHFDNKEIPNSVYMGTIPEYAYNGSIITVTPDESEADAQLIVDAQPNSSIYLGDPIRVIQNNDKAFTMDINGPGYLRWAGENNIAVNQTFADNDKNTINFHSDSDVELVAGNQILAINHRIYQESGGKLQINGIYHNPHDPLDPSNGRPTKWLPYEVSLHGNLLFNLDNTTINKTSTALLQVEATHLADEIDLSGSTVSVFNSPSVLDDIVEAAKVGDVRFYLIDSMDDNNFDENKMPANEIVEVKAGLFKVDMYVTNDGFTDDNNNIQANMQQLILILPQNVNPLTLVPETSLMADAQAAGMGYLVNTANWLADHSYQQADMALQRTKQTWSPFAGMDGTYIEMGHKVQVDINMATALIGVAFQKPFDSSRFLLAGFIEGGLAKYHVYANYGPGHIPDIKAEGRFSSIDFGLIMRQKWDNGFRLEAAARYGWLYSQFDSLDLTVTNQAGVDVPLDYGYTTNFFAAHVGLGYEHQINDVSKLDFVGRYYYTHQQGKTINVDGHDISFNGIDSHRVRAGLRYSRDHTPRISYYFGAYAEHDFSERASGEVRGLTFRSEKFGGTTGIGEVGVIFHSTDDRPWNAEAGFQFYGGNIRGFSGGFRFGYQF
jgi:hypothetical protein